MQKEEAEFAKAHRESVEIFEKACQEFVRRWISMDYLISSKCHVLSFFLELQDKLNVQLLDLTRAEMNYYSACAQECRKMLKEWNFGLSKILVKKCWTFNKYRRHLPLCTIKTTKLLNMTKAKSLFDSTVNNCRILLRKCPRIESSLEFLLLQHRPNFLKMQICLGWSNCTSKQKRLKIESAIWPPDAL